MDLKTRNFLFVAIFYAVCLPLSAQRNRTLDSDGEPKQKVFVTAGPEVNLILPTDFGANSTAFYGDTMTVFAPQVSFRLGMNLRFDFSRKFSLQTGLYYVQRTYAVRGGITNNARNGFDSIMFDQQLGYVGFELPIMGIFYVQLGERWFLNNSIGLSLDFFPSSVQDTVQDYQIYGGRNSWIRPSLKAAIGIEFRTEFAGYFYLGGQFHRPLVALFDGYVQRDSWGTDNLTKASISGTYFSIDLKYFFPPGKKNKFFSNR